MAIGIVTNYRSAPRFQSLLLADTVTAVTASQTFAAVGCVPTASTGRHNVTASVAAVAGGSTPAISAQLQQSYDGVNYVNVGSAVAQTGAGATTAAVTCGAPYVRTVVAVSGTPTSITFSVFDLVVTA